MNHETWEAVEDYVGNLVVQPDAVLDRVLRACVDAGLPEIQVPPGLGKMLHLLARSIGAQSILEIGTLGGYSTIWLARALADGGRLISLECEAHHAKVATSNIAMAGLADRVDVRVGAALATLPTIAAEDMASFDLVFIDADKPSNPGYFEWALKLTRVGGWIVVDNVVRAGDVLDASSDDASVQGVRRLNDLIASETRVKATTIQTVSSKGYDGFMLALVVG